MIIAIVQTQDFTYVPPIVKIQYVGGSLEDARKKYGELERDTYYDKSKIALLVGEGITVRTIMERSPIK